MRSYMKSSFPQAIVEAARIDGSSEFRTFISIAIPMMKPAIAVQAIFTFVSSWNNYFTPALVLHTDTKKTLPSLSLAALPSVSPEYLEHIYTNLGILPSIYISFGTFRFVSIAFISQIPSFRDTFPSPCLSKEMKAPGFRPSFKKNQIFLYPLPESSPPGLLREM